MKKIITPFLLVLITLNFKYANSQSLFINSAIKASKPIDRSIDFTVNVRQILGNTVKVEFILAYRKLNGEWDIWDNSVFAVIQPNSNHSITIPGVQIHGNSGQYQIVIAYRNVVTNMWYGLREWKINNKPVYNNPQTLDFTFLDPTEELNLILNKIELGLGGLKMAANQYEYFKVLKGEIREKFQKEKDKIGNVQSVIKVANDVLGYINTFNEFSNEKDVVKQYFMLMKKLANNTLPYPFNEAFKSYAELGIQFKTAIDRIAENYGQQTFKLAPYAYTVYFKIRRRDYKIFGNAFDEYYSGEEIGKIVKNYKIFAYKDNIMNNKVVTNLVTQFDASSETEGSEISISLSGLDQFGGAVDRVFLLVEFKNDQSVVIPLGDQTFVTSPNNNNDNTIGNTWIKVAIDLRPIGILDNMSKDSRFNISVFKP